MPFSFNLFLSHHWNTDVMARARAAMLDPWNENCVYWERQRQKERSNECPQTINLHTRPGMPRKAFPGVGNNNCGFKVPYTESKIIISTWFGTYNWHDVLKKSWMYSIGWWVAVI